MGNSREETGSVRTWLRRSALAIPVLLILVPLILKSSFIKGFYVAALEEYKAGDYFFSAKILQLKGKKDARDYGLLGWALLKSGDLDEAAQNFSRSLALEPDLPNSHCGMGFFYLEKGRTSEAIQSFNKGVYEDSRDIDCIVGKGMLLEKLGKTANAMDIYVRVLSLDGENSYARKRYDLLSKKASSPSHKTARCADCRPGAGRLF